MIMTLEPIGKLLDSKKLHKPKPGNFEGLPIRPSKEQTRLVIDNEYLEKGFMAIFPKTVSLVYSVLAKYANYRSQRCFPSIATIMKDSGIKNLADLKGKHIGSSSGGLSSVMIKAVLTNEGLSNKDVDLINVRYNLSQALLSHKVDAVTGMMRNFEVPQLELTNHKVIAFFPEEHGVPNYSELVFITHLDNVKDKRIPHFMAALKKAVAYLDEHPEETWLQFIKQYPEANNPVNREAWFTTMPYFAENPSEFDFEDWQRFAKFLKQNHLIKKIQPISRYAVMV